MGNEITSTFDSIFGSNEKVAYTDNANSTNNNEILYIPKVILG